MKIIGKLFGLEDEDIRFVMVDDVITLITEMDIKEMLLSSSQNFDLIYGETNTNRNILFFDVNYQKRNNISAAGWAISKNNLEPDSLKNFDAISFSSKALDAFYSPKKAFMWEKNAEKMWGDNEKNRIPFLITREFEEYGKDFDVEIEGIKIHIKFDIRISYNMRKNIRGIGEAIPCMQFQFSESQDIKELPKFYLFAFDLMKFLSFRQNICFDKIVLKRLIVDGENAGKYNDSAEVHFYANSEATKYNLTEREIITIDDIGDAFPVLFQNIARRRIDGIVDDLYIPLNNDDARTVSYSSFLSAALSFEGEYSRLYPEEESKTDKVFEEIKKNVLNYIEKQKALFENSSGKESKSAKEIIEQMENQIKNLDSSLEKKFNRAIKKNKDIIKEFIERIEKLELQKIKEINWGECLSKMRNHIGHGNPLLIEQEHVAVFRITRCLIYVLILKECEVENEKIKYIIEKLF
ncbi:hypothetical protein DW091_00755 [Eubacterium sp. AM05-23]|uniref:hypothetical protein n=1 Tax=Eubacterium TaxID=1730 RepID=UPI000E5420FB|nr:MULTISPECIES: hypothetical protein [Eubacterium]RHO61116.1 hypothetical protein DW091_00755 [Eubacterium sp. AM05-23]